MGKFTKPEADPSARDESAERKAKREAARRDASLEQGRRMIEDQNERAKATGFAKLFDAKAGYGQRVLEAKKSQEMLRQMREQERGRRTVIAGPIPPPWMPRAIDLSPRPKKRKLEELRTSDLFDENLSYEGISHIFDTQKVPGKTAYKLLKADKAWIVAHFLDQFEDLTITSGLLEALVEKGQERQIAMHLSRPIELQEGQSADLPLLDYKDPSKLAKFPDPNAAEPNTYWAYLPPKKGKEIQPLEYRERGKELTRLIENGKGWMIVAFMDRFEGLNQKDLADRFFEAGQAYYVAHNLDKFSDLKLNMGFAKRLIAAGEGLAVVENIRSFENLDHDKLADELIKVGQGDIVWAFVVVGSKASDLDKRLVAATHELYGPEAVRVFSTLSPVEVAKKLIAAGEGHLVAAHLDQVEGLKSQVVYKEFLRYDSAAKQKGDLSSQPLEPVVRYLHKFEGISHEGLINTLMYRGKGELIARYLYNFEGVDHQEVARKFYKEGMAVHVAQHLHNFRNIDHQELVDDLAASGNYEAIAMSMPRFNLDQKEVATSMIEAGAGLILVAALPNFPRLDAKDVATDLIDNNQASTTIPMLLVTTSVDVDWLAEKIIESGASETVANQLYDEVLGQGDEHTLAKLEHSPLGTLIKTNPDFFASRVPVLRKLGLRLHQANRMERTILVDEALEGKDAGSHQKLALKLAGGTKEEATALVENMNLEMQDGFKGTPQEKFKDLDHQEILDALFEAGHYDVVARNLNAFRGIDKRAAAFELIENGADYLLCNYLNKYEELVPEDIAMKLIKEKRLLGLVTNLRHPAAFSTVEPYKIAHRMIENDLVNELVAILPQFPKGGITKEMLLEIKKAGGDVPEAYAHILNPKRPKKLSAEEVEELAHIEETRADLEAGMDEEAQRPFKRYTLMDYIKWRSKWTKRVREREKDKRKKAGKKR